MLLAAIDSALVVICALCVTAAVAQQPRIIGGTAAHSGAYPFFAHIRHNGDPQCGASLISSNWIATAAHCVTVNSTTLGPQPISPASSLTITLGSSHSQDFDDGAFTIPAASIAIHPRYDVHTVMYDFALVELATSVNFTRNIQPIPIDDASHQDYGVLKTVGFGKTNEEASAGSDALMQVDIVKLPDALCSEAYPMFRRANGALFCTGQTPGRDTCFGDSGGPLV
ncbi:trypsin-like serine protease, partial [Ramicandelaber brevisporus]